MKFRSQCKINLFLHVLGRRSDGYHELQSLFYFPDIYDEISIREKQPVSYIGLPSSLTIAGPFSKELNISSGDNIILKAYHLLKEKFADKIPDLDFELIKYLPVASGIGGGSANAATVLRELNSVYELGLSQRELYRIGVKSGADVPACVLSKPCMAEGIGEIITEVELPKLNILLVNPLIAVSTAEIFRMGFEEMKGDRLEVTGFKKTQSLIDFLEGTGNDLEINAKRICPEVNEVLENIAVQPGCLLHRMSGSGATCFGIFETIDKARMARENIMGSRPEWWCEVG